MAWVRRVLVLVLLEACWLTSRLSGASWRQCSWRPRSCPRESGGDGASSGDAATSMGAARRVKSKQAADRETSLGMSVIDEVAVSDIETGGRAHDARGRERE